jgi:hypothetical protein
VIAYTRTPLEAGEAMTFNFDCLGCVSWFQYGKIVESSEFRGYRERFNQP